MSGQLEGVFAEYLDPALIEQRRFAASSQRLTSVSPHAERPDRSAAVSKDATYLER